MADKLQAIPYPHFPCEACENFKLRTDWERRDTTCLQSFQEGLANCTYVGWGFFKKNDPKVNCSLHSKPT